MSEGVVPGPGSGCSTWRSGCQTEIRLLSLEFGAGLVPGPGSGVGAWAGAGPRVSGGLGLVGGVRRRVNAAAPNPAQVTGPGELPG